MTRKSTTLLPLLLFALLYLVPPLLHPVAIMDEARYGEIPREMLSTGDWVVPHLNGLRYFEKPALGYWIHALSMRLFGQNPFALRLPSALAVGLTALLLSLLVRRATGDRASALFAGLIYLTSLMVMAVGTSCVLDSLLTLFVTAAIVFFYLAAHAARPGAQRGHLALFGLACGAAFLVKGFIAFAVPVITIVPFMLWERRWKDLFRFAWLPLLVALVVVLPWAIAIHLREPDFWRYFFWEEHIRRYFSDHPQHEEPFWFLIPFLVGGALPWTALAPAAAGALRRDAQTPLLKYALCWFVLPYLFFSASSGKLGTYILPCFPPLAILIALGLTAAFRARRTKAIDRGALALAVVLLLTVVTVAIVQFLPDVRQRIYAPHEQPKWFALTIVLLAWAGCALAATRTPTLGRKIAWLSVSPLLFMLAMPLITPERTIVVRSAVPLLEASARDVPPDAILVSDEKYTHSVCWFFKRDDVYFLAHGPGEFKYGLGYDDARGRWLDPAQFRRMVEANRGKRAVILVTNRRRYNAYKKDLPPPTLERAEDFWIDKHTLVFVRYN